MEYVDLCDACFQHVILESKHEICNTHCRPPFLHSGGGTYSETPEAQEAQMEATYYKHNYMQCCVDTCPPNHGVETK